MVLVLALPVTLLLRHLLARDPRRPATTVLTHAAPFVLWVGILLLRPHKEERFLFPAFPALYIGAAASLDARVADDAADAREDPTAADDDAVSSERAELWVRPRVDERGERAGESCATRATAARWPSPAPTASAPI